MFLKRDKNDSIVDLRINIHPDVYDGNLRMDSDMIGYVRKSKNIIFDI